MGDRFVVNATKKFTVLDVTGTSQAVAGSSSSKSTTPAVAAGSAAQAADATAAAPPAKKSSSKNKKPAQPISLDVSITLSTAQDHVYEACSCPFIGQSSWY
jgi:hypothetical protein